jgi:hypothetical protein
VTVSLIQEMYAYENRQSFLKDIDPMQDDLWVCFVWGRGRSFSQS